LYRIDDRVPSLEEFYVELSSLQDWLKETENVLDLPIEPANEQQLEKLLEKAKVR
jgi:hypothetical protein